MKRQAFAQIVAWADQKDRLPLIIRGARQVGKSYLVRWLAKNRFKSFIEINFERSPDLRKVFETKDIKSILLQLEILFRISIKSGETLLFLDEVQCCPEVLSCLRWFAEDSPDIHVVVTGSLLDFALEEYEHSMPVGRVTYMFLEPFSYLEFLYALGEQKLADYLGQFQLKEEITETIHKKALELFKYYLLIGGMPKAIKTFRDRNSFIEVEKVHRDLLESFRSDFHKYRNRVPVTRITKVFDSISRQIGKKFIYTQVDTEERAQAIRQSFELLLLSRLGFKVLASHCNGIPLGAEIDSKSFKVFFLDVGLNSTNSGFLLRKKKN